MAMLLTVDADLKAPYRLIGEGFFVMSRAEAILWAFSLFFETGF